MTISQSIFDGLKISILVAALAALPPAIVSGDEPSVFLRGKMQFEVPPNFTFAEGSLLPDRLEGTRRISAGDAHNIRVTYRTVDDLRASHPALISPELAELFERDTQVTESDLLELLSNSKSLVLAKYAPMSIIGNSRTRIDICGRRRGEVFFRAQGDGLLAPGKYIFESKIVIDDGVTTVQIAYSDPDFRIPEKMSEIFERRGDYWYWKSRETRRDFYELIDQYDSSVPSNLLDLAQGWDQIMSSLEVACEPE